MANEISIADRERYRDIMNRSIGLGVLGFLSGTAAAIFAPESIAGLFLFAGIGLYYLGVIGYIGIWQYTGVRLFDEHEEQIERRTGHIVLLIVLFVTIFGLPADLILNGTGTVDVHPTIRGAIWGYAVLALIGLFMYGYADDQYS